MDDWFDAGTGGAAIDVVALLDGPAGEAVSALVDTGALVGLGLKSQLERLGPAVHAVRGNVDSAEVQARLPLTRVVNIGGARIAMVHDGGPADGRLELPPLSDAIDDISSRGRLPLLVGGSGLYYRAVVDDLKFPPRSPEVDPGPRARRRGARGAQHRTIDGARYGRARRDP